MRHKWKWSEQGTGRGRCRCQRCGLQASVHSRVRKGGPRAYAGLSVRVQVYRWPGAEWTETMPPCPGQPVRRGPSRGVTARGGKP